MHMVLLMAGQRPLADDHTWTGWQPRTHATFNISKYFERGEVLGRDFEIRHDGAAGVGGGHGKTPVVVCASIADCGRFQR